LFDRIDRVISRFTRLPKLPERKRRIRVQRDIATCGAYRNSLGEPALRQQMGVNDHVEYAYQALCALAYDLGVPRGAGQTPFEFLRSFPKELEMLRQEAAELTQLYVQAAYGPVRMSPRVEDRLRRFWIRYERARSRLLK